MSTLTIDVIKSIGEPLAAQMLPGWAITWILCKPEDIGGALAMVYPSPKRQMATIKIAPHPPGESVAESIAHELTHAALSPLTGLIEYSEAAVMVEEPIAERLGKLLAKLSPGLARAVSNAVRNPRTDSTLVRARISALATRRRNSRGRTMVSKDTIMSALEALKSGDAAAATDVLAAILAEMVGGGEPDGDEPPAAKDPPPQDVPAEQPMNKDPMAYRGKSPAVSRAREAQSELDMILNDERQRAKEAIVSRLREAMPEHSGLPAVEKEIMSAENYASAKKIANIAIAMGAGQSRARSGQEAGSAKERASAIKGASDDEMKALGCDDAWIKNYRSEYAKDPKGAEAMLDGVRARHTSISNPWKGGAK